MYKCWTCGAETHGMLRPDYLIYCTKCWSLGRETVLGPIHAIAAQASAVPLPIPRLDQFDKITATITTVRGKEYQHPSVDFAKANALKACVQNCTDPLVKHVLEMLCLKIARLTHNPSHLDSWIDIAGYARCGVMVTDPKPKEETNGK